MRLRRKPRRIRVRKSDLYIVVSNDLDHAHGPYNDLETAAKLAIAESRSSGRPHMPVAFDFTTGVVITPAEIEAAFQKNVADHPDLNRGYL
jgi:hypothetical protein